MQLYFVDSYVLVIVWRFHVGDIIFYLLRVVDRQAIVMTIGEYLRAFYTAMSFGPNAVILSDPCDIIRSCYFNVPGATFL